ncbi:hypothetical protein UlMin_023904 [Ulmus minor]
MQELSWNFCGFGRDMASRTLSGIDFEEDIVLLSGISLVSSRLVDNNCQFEEDELLARVIKESLNVESPPRYDNGNTYQPVPVYYPMGYKISAGCQTEIGFGRYLTCLNGFWHPEYKLCYLIPTNHAGLIEYRGHPFWIQKYYPFHEHDGTPQCCSSERIEEFYEGLNMKLEQQVPLLLVERQALNEAREGEKNGHYPMPETRGLCLSEEQTISTISRCPRFGARNRAMDTKTEPYKLTRHCEVTAILILYGLPSFHTWLCILKITLRIVLNMWFLKRYRRCLYLLDINSIQKS